MYTTMFFPPHQRYEDVDPVGCSQIGPVNIISQVLCDVWLLHLMRNRYDRELLNIVAPGPNWCQMSLHAQPVGLICFMIMFYSSHLINVQCMCFCIIELIFYDSSTYNFWKFFVFQCLKQLDDIAHVVFMNISDQGLYRSRKSFNGNSVLWVKVRSSGPQ